MPIQSVNPATGEVAAIFDEFNPDWTRTVVDSAARAWEGWRKTGFAERSACLKRAATLLRDRAPKLAATMALEMGKPVRQGEGEARKCADVCDYYADRAETMLKPEPIEGVGERAFVSFEPLGVLLLVMPWNFPLWQVFRIAAPSLMAGNAVVLKHASNVPQCALAVEEILHDAGLPDNVFRSLLIGAGQVESVLDHPAVFGVSLTGSEPAGRKVAAAAGARLKKSVMELGGSDPFIVLPDADLEKAVPTAVLSRCGNAGQTCIAAKRFIVFEEIFEKFLSGLSAGMDKLVMGDPMSQDTDLGPMASETLRLDLQAQVNRCLEAGGILVRGGEIPSGPGFFYPPTIITDVSPEAEVCREELFGPAALVFRVKDLKEAVALANDTPFGLGGSVWTRDVEAGLCVAARVRSGCVFVNGLVRSDPRLPFGGVRASGYGRELNVWGIREFVNVKSVCVG